MRALRVRLQPLATICLATGVLCAAPQSPSIRITAPTDGTFLMGAVRLTLAFQPVTVIPQVQNVRWFADGKQVCTASIPPYACEWDAGEMVNEHLIRAVATLKGGERLNANSRTKGVEFAEAVDVDVIQITAVVTDGDGRFVPGLKVSDFKAYDDDKVQRLTNFAAENIPLELVAAIDGSRAWERCPR